MLEVLRLVTIFAGRTRGYGAKLGGMGARHGAHADATGLAYGRIHQIWPWPVQEAHEGHIFVANETAPIDIRQKYWTDVY